MPHSVSVVIPTYNRVEVLYETLDSIASQSIKPLEVIVVDQSIKEVAFLICNLCERFKSRLNLKYIHLTQPSSTRARNVGMREVTGDWIIFCDDDVIWPKVLIADLQSRINEFSSTVLIGG